MNVFRKKNDLIILGKEISKYCVGMEGNLSMKKKNSIIIKASGSNLKKLTNKDLVKYDLDGKQLNNFKKKGSMELPFHIFFLKNFDIKYVTHTHPVNTLKILVSDKIYEFANQRLFPDQVVFNGKKSCIVPYNTPGLPLTEMIEKSINEFINEEKYFPNLILLQNHGIIVCGNSIDQCIYINEICEKSAEIFLTSNKKNYLTDNQINELIINKEEIYRKSLIS
jgi:ribulose-5-phosphate 4-epimerase/fuculose-1-phosphate aldolase